MRFAQVSWKRGAAAMLLLALIVPVLAACGSSAPSATAPTAAAPAAEATQAPAPTSAPAPTEAAAATAAPAATAGTEATAATAPAGQMGGLTENNGLAVASVKSCDKPYAGLIKEIAAVDKLTVRFTMCSPDPAFQ